MPWELLLNRLDQYLRIVHITTVVSGIVFSVEVFILAMTGPPSDRRDQIAAWTSAVVDAGLSTIQIVLIVSLSVVFAYGVGLVLQRLVAIAVSFAIVLFFEGNKGQRGEIQETSAPVPRPVAETGAVATTAKTPRMPNRRLRTGHHLYALGPSRNF